MTHLQLPRTLLGFEETGVGSAEPGSARRKKSSSNDLRRSTKSLTVIRTLCCEGTSTHAHFSSAAPFCVRARGSCLLCFLPCIQHTVCLLLTILATMTLIIERVALGAVCMAMHLASAQAFLPSTSLSSTSAWKRVSTPGQTVGNDARGAARSAGKGRSAETAMSGGEHDLYVVGAGYLG